ncbi:hypothetical protein Tco_0281479 [Tanacetum coccineum]
MGTPSREYEFAHYFGPNQPGIESDCDSEDMEEEVEYMTDDEVVMSEQEERVKNTEDALINIIKSIKKEMKDDIMKKQIEASTPSIGNETSSIASNEVDIDDDKQRMLYRRGLVKRRHVCKPIHVTYDDRNGEDYRMWPTCNPDSKFCFGYNEAFGVNEQGGLRMWICFCDHERRTMKGSYMGFADFLQEEYAREIGDPYSRRFDEYNRVFKNEIEHLSNEYILRIGKKGYVLDDVWEKCQQNYKKTNEAWHDEAYEEDEMWRIGDEKIDYDPPYVNIETFEVKKYSFKGGRSFICITDREDEALPLGRVNGAQFKAMIRKELEGYKYVHEVT